MRALLLAALVLATPLAAAARFVDLAPTSPGEGSACGPAACFALLPGEAALRVVGGSAYAFQDARGATLAAGRLCAATLLDVPPGATLLVVQPGRCA